MLFSHLKSRKQRVSLNNTYSEWIDILFGVLQRSILGPLLFNIFLCDLLLFLHDIRAANNADNNTSYFTGVIFSNILIKSENAAETLLQWFKDKRMNRSSRPEVFCKKGVLKNFAKFTGKHLCQSSFFNKVAGLRRNFIKKETLAQVFSCEFCEIFRNTFFCRTPLVAASK